MGDLASALDSAFDETLNSPKPETTESPAPAEQAAPPAEVKEETAAPEPAKAPAEEESGDVLFDKLTPEQIEKLKSTPEGRALHRGLMQSYTAKMQALSEQQKLWDALNNPDTRRQAVEAMARAVGIEIKPTDQPQREQAAKVADDISEEWSKVVGAEAAAQLRPLIEKTALQAVNGMLVPLQQATDTLQKDAKARQSEGLVAQFRAHVEKKGLELTPEIEQKMAQLGKELTPAEGIDTVDQGLLFLDRLYRLATADESDAAKEKRILERMKKNQQSSEPTRGVPSVGREKRSNITKEMSLNEALQVGIEEALSEAGLR